MLIPPLFFFRVSFPCPYVKNGPTDETDFSLDLPESCRLKRLADLAEGSRFADVRIGWNELGLAVQAEIKGKSRPPVGDAAQPRGSDGLTLWIDTRDARTGHRATRYCHQFHFLATGGGPDRDEPTFTQSKINRAIHDAPVAAPHTVPFRAQLTKSGYRVEAFLSAAALHGFDPEQNRRLGFYYAVRDAELGEEVLTVGSDFPYWEDPSCWSILELARESG